MRNLNSKIRSQKEAKMKMTTVVKISLYAGALGLACLLPVTVRAQSDVMPDSFAFSADEAMAAPVVQIAQIDDVNQTPATFEGTISLPYNLKCAGRNLKAGQYLLSVKSEGTARVVSIHGSGEDMSIRVREVPMRQTATQSALLVRKSNHGHRLEAVYVEGLNATLYLNASASHAGMERLPIS
jgi:hypothetical protein